jgi:hypothetical protein
VSVPSDCNYEKLRTCRYEVVGEYQGELLKPLYSASLDNGVDYDYDDEEEYDNDYDWGWNNDNDEDDEVYAEDYDDYEEDYDDYN